MLRVNKILLWGAIVIDKNYLYWLTLGDTHGVMVTIVGNGHGNLSSNPGWGYLHFI